VKNAILKSSYNIGKALIAYKDAASIIQYSDICNIRIVTLITSNQSLQSKYRIELISVAMAQAMKIAILGNKIATNLKNYCEDR